jgi:hypothetical protein
VAWRRYFKGHVQNVQPGKDIELSVYCDRDVFSWLMQYTKVPDGPGTPTLTNSNIIAILVSSNFLQMDKLVTVCTQYIARNCADLLLAGVEVESLSDVLLKKVTKVCPDGFTDPAPACACAEMGMASVMFVHSCLHTLEICHSLAAT